MRTTPQMYAASLLLPSILASLVPHWSTLSEAYVHSRISVGGGWLQKRSDNNGRRLHASMDELSDMSRSSVLQSQDVLRAAAAVTRDSCPLLGIKSVGVDYGLVRTGVAATVGYNPKPLEIISDLNNTEVCERVVEICRSEQAQQVIVGLPLHKNGTEAEQTHLTRVFAAELAIKVLHSLGPDVPVYMWDERYTSKEAAARAHSRDPNQVLYGILDAEAACIILENFYTDSGEGAERVPVSEELVNKYQEIWQERQKEEEALTQAALADRSFRLQWRKDAMERDRELEAQAATSSTSIKSKKKKKGKQKR